jgi:hypothetical protein
MTLRIFGLSRHRRARGKREVRKMSPRSVYNAVAFLPRLLEFGYERGNATPA